MEAGKSKIRHFFIHACVCAGLLVAATVATELPSWADKVTGGQIMGVQLCNTQDTYTFTPCTARPGKNCTGRIKRCTPPTFTSWGTRVCSFSAHWACGGPGGNFRCTGDGGVRSDVILSGNTNGCIPAPF